MKIVVTGAGGMLGSDVASSPTTRATRWWR